MTIFKFKYMNKNGLIWICTLILMIAGLSSCSSDDQESVSTILNGTWDMVWASYGFSGVEEYQPGEITVTFDEVRKTLNVENKKKIRFLPSGSYPYKTTTVKQHIYTYQEEDVEIKELIIPYSDETFGDQEIRYTYGFINGLLYLDRGVEADGPGYWFKKLK